MKKSVLALLLFCTATIAQSQSAKNPSTFPDSIFTGKQGKMHIQGMAIDKANSNIYFSFTDKLVKMDFTGKLLGSVTGFVGHLGDLDFNETDGKIYGSLEYKNDVIGKGIRSTLGISSNTEAEGFYIAIFDGKNITRNNMDAEKENLLRTVYLKEVVDDYKAEVNEMAHRFACSGIDGLAFAPAIGSKKDSKKYLYVAYGIFGDTARNDNDNQVILQYDIQDWSKYAQPLYQKHLHQSGPKKADAKYFVKTGNTSYGIQNLAWDETSGNFYAAVYKGKKKQYPNYDLFVIDGDKKPTNARITSDNQSIKVQALSLLPPGGWYFKWGATGLSPIGDGFFYISHNEKTADGEQQSTIYKYKWVGDKDRAFIRDY